MQIFSFYDQQMLWEKSYQCDSKKTAPSSCPSFPDYQIQLIRKIFDHGRTYAYVGRWLTNDSKVALSVNVGDEWVGGWKIFFQGLMLCWTQKIENGKCTKGDKES